MKKKFISMGIALSFTLSLVGCGKTAINETIKEEKNISTNNQLTDNQETINKGEDGQENNNLNNKVQEQEQDIIGKGNKDNDEKKNNEKTNTNVEEKAPKQEEKNNNKPPKSTNENNTSKSTSNVEMSWYYVPRTDGVPPRCIEAGGPLLKKYNCYYLGNTSEKVIYLTFDEGYENGYSGKILDILKANNVKAAFFVTTPYIESNKELIKRMVDEGHLVCNHSTHHPSMASISDINKFNEEFSVCEKSFKEVTGKDMPKYFRPPMGKFSETSLKRTNDLGYKTIFWSFAYGDWQPANQPSHEKAKKTITERLHPGAIYLLHAVSKTNTEVLDEVIKELKYKGYSFKSLDDLPKY